MKIIQLASQRWGRRWRDVRQAVGKSVHIAPMLSRSWSSPDVMAMALKLRGIVRAMLRLATGALRKARNIHSQRFVFCVWFRGYLRMG
jgi:hypothetical protein